MELPKLRFVGAALSLALAANAGAAIWPEQWGSAVRVSTSPAKLADKAIWAEYGLEEGEVARYERDGKQFQATALRLHDSTSALAAYQWQMPPQAEPSTLERLAANIPGGLVVAHGNYWLRFDDHRPNEIDLVTLYEVLPHLHQAPLPTLPDFFPKEGLATGTQRYILGPEALARFAPAIPPSVAAFRLGAEGQIGSFNGGDGDTRLALFSYPTPAMAREQAEAFGALPGVLVKRSGPLVAAILSSPSPDEAERILAKVRYQGAVSWSEYVPSQRDNIGDLIYNIVILILILAGFSIVGGIAVGGTRTLWRELIRRGDEVEPEPMILLNIRDRQR
ncbi:MAG: hypothetical protein IPM24_11285 [Bryobacterales bacterium]|nr:hypothetical protein [Bryobacterales bacterium]